MNPSILLDFLLSQSNGNTLWFFEEDFPLLLCREAILRGLQVHIIMRNDEMVGAGWSAGAGDYYFNGFGGGWSEGADYNYYFIDNYPCREFLTGISLGEGLDGYGHSSPIFEIPFLS